MPTYKTHSIHGEIIFPNIQSKTEINIEDLKLYCIGPDTLITSDYKVFNKQHEYNVQNFFINLLKEIKKNKLQENGKVMAFLYGQIDHLTLDSVTHPLIYYTTENLEKKHIMSPHALVECLIDEYIMNKYDKNDFLYYHKMLTTDTELINLINSVYKKSFNSYNAGIKYNIGAFSTIVFELLVRRNSIGIVPLLQKINNTGNLMYTNDIKKAVSYLNLDHNKWFDPETNEQHTESFDDLWNKASEISLETIEDVNKYLYQDKTLTNSLILNNTSYNTGLSCEKGQTLKYVKKLKKEISK